MGYIPNPPGASQPPDVAGAVLLGVIILAVILGLLTFSFVWLLQR
jgi:hypothetical protein